jgi:hypothetical protein
MSKPQQPELRRSGFVPALDPDATESELAAHERPGTKGRTGPVPEEQRPGHHPDEEQDKPDLDKFAERLGIVPEGEEPEDAPRVEDDDATVTRLADAPSKKARAARKASRKAAASKKPAAKTAPEQPEEKATAPAARNWSPIGLALVGPVTGVLIVRRIVRTITRRR